MATHGILSISMASVIENVLKDHGTRLSDKDLASRKAEEAGEQFEFLDCSLISVVTELICEASLQTGLIDRKIRF